MKIIPNMEKTFEHGILYMGVSDWRDYKTQEVKGVEIKCVEGEFFEEFDVRIKGAKREIFKELEKRQLISFVDLKGNTWNFNGKKGITYSASFLQTF